MRLFQILGNQVNIVKDEHYYTDTIENYLLDGGVVEKDGEKMIIVVHDSQQDYCEINGVVLPYPNEFFDNIIDGIDTLITNKEKREYIAPDIDEIKAQKLTELKTIRDTEEVKPIAYNGNLFDFDEKARDRINSAITALSITGQSIEWTTADNTNVLVTADDLRGVVANVAVRSNELHVKYRELKEKVKEAQTTEELEAIEL